jgi:hypothetical protein
MTTAAKKLMLGAAAFAVAGALISPVVAFADTEDTGTDSASVGTSAGDTPKKRSGRAAKKPTTTASAPTADAPDAPEVAAIPTVGADATADATGAFDNPLFQNPLIWLGTPNPTPPPAIVEFETLPLEDVDAPLRGAFGWMEDFEFEACVLGLSSVNKGQTVTGPYGTSTTGFSSSGCA